MGVFQTLCLDTSAPTGWAAKGVALARVAEGCVYVLTAGLAVGLPESTSAGCRRKDSHPLLSKSGVFYLAESHSEWRMITEQQHGLRSTEVKGGRSGLYHSLLLWSTARQVQTLNRLPGADGRRAEDVHLMHDY